jgi:hypothetical protein
MLRHSAFVAIIWHNYAPSRLTIAKMRPDSPKRVVLEPVVENLFQVRIAAVRAYQEHVKTHTRGEQGGCWGIARTDR